MKTEIQKLFSKVEIVWNLVWVFCLVFFCVSSYLNSATGIALFFDLVLAQYILQVMLFLAAILSLTVFGLRLTIDPKQTATQSDLLAEGGRIVFAMLNIAFYAFNSIEFVKYNFSFLWLILPWLLWVPIILDLSTQVKKEFSWIK